MTRADLVASMATESGWTKAASDRALRALLASIRTSLKHGQPVTLVGFGTFSVGRRKARAPDEPSPLPELEAVPLRRFRADVRRWLEGAA